MVVVSEHIATAKDNHEKHAQHEQLRELGEQQAEVLRERLERAEKEHRERQPEVNALETAKELAEKTAAQEEAVQTEKSPARRRGPITKKQLSNSFDSQMSHVRTHMSPTSRAFSKLIHSRPVEVVSEAVGSTIARPNALLSGSIAAFIAITALYLTAKYYSFELSGFETIGAFIVGWILGILYDYFSVMIRGRNN